MESPIIDIKQESYFPFTFKIMGALLIFASILVLLSDVAAILKVLLPILLPILGLAMMTTRYGLKIDVTTPSYTVYTWLLGFKIGTPEAFTYVEKIYINEVTESATISSYSGLRSDVQKRLFKAFMKLDNGEKIHLDTDKHREKLEKRVREYQAAMASIQPK